MNVLSARAALAANVVNLPPNFAEVQPGIYRGGRPSTEALEFLEQQGIKTIIDLESYAPAVASERSALSSSSINFISIPFDTWKKPKDANVARVLALLNDSDNYPIYIHCEHGQDRTGLLIGLFRVDEEGWTPAAAFQEMLQHGFHKILFFLDDYFDHKTHYGD